jgi:hypothetical protein
MIQTISGFGFFSHEFIVARSFGVFKSSSSASKQFEKKFIHSSVLSLLDISL